MLPQHRWSKLSRICSVKSVSSFRAIFSNQLLGSRDETQIVHPVFWTPKSDFDLHMTYISKCIGSCFVSLWGK